ncbi:MAG: hypothetical protein ABJC13_11480 [Acidobacteriota bacterium]
MIETSAMSQVFVTHAIALLLERARSAQRILGELDGCMTLDFRGIKEFQAERTEALSYRLEGLGQQLPVLLDLMGMDSTRQKFLSSWELSSKDLEFTKIVVTGEDAFLVSPPLGLVNDILEILSAGSEGVLGEDPADIRTLEYILRSTPQILNARGISPKRELDIQRVLHEHLENTFPDYTRKVSLPKGLKCFEPDGAIPSLGVLIEVKYIDTKRKVDQIFSGIMEDLSGYGGTKDWTRYYSVIYQTEPFVNETRFDRSLQLSGNSGRWRPIVVAGTGQPKRKTAPKP